MSGGAVIPSIRVRDLEAAVDFYRNVFGFVVERSDGPNRSLTRGDARIMLEAPSEVYSPAYNAAILERLGSVSPHALYMEAPVDELYGGSPPPMFLSAETVLRRPFQQIRMRV